MVRRLWQTRRELWSNMRSAAPMLREASSVKVAAVVVAAAVQDTLASRHS